MSQAVPDEVVAYYDASIEFDVTKSKNTNLDAVPERATIQFEGEDEPRENIGISLNLLMHNDDDAMFDAVMGDGIGVQFLIERAMLDPDATVIPDGAA